MNVKTTLVLLGAIALIAAGVIWLGPTLGVWLHLSSTPPDATGLGTMSTVHNYLQPEKLTRIEIQQGKDSLVFEKDVSGEWNLPGGWPTRKKPGVEELLDLITHLDSRFLPRQLDVDYPASLFGLEGNVAASVLIKAGGSEYRMKFAQKPDPDESNRANWPTYLQLAEKDGDSYTDREEVIRLSPDVVRILKRPVAYYQQRRLFPGKRPPGAKDDKDERLEAASIEINDGLNNYVLVRSGDDWHLRSPHADHLLPEKSKKIATALPDVWAEEFVEAPKDLKEYDLDENAEKDKPRQVIVTIAGENGKEQRKVLLIGKESKRAGGVPFGETPTERHYAKLKGNPQIFLVNYDKLKDGIFVPYTELRDPGVVTFNSNDVVAADLIRDKEKIVFTKNDYRWSMAVYEKDDTTKDWKKEPSLRSDVETGKITGLLGYFQGLKIDNKDDIIYDSDPKNAARYGLDDTAMTLKVDLEEEVKKDGKKPEPPFGAPPDKKDKDVEKKKRSFTLRVGEETDKDGKVTDKAFVRVDSEERINRVVAKNVAEQTRREVADFRKRRLFDWASNETKTISVQLKDEKIVLEQKDAKWSLLEPTKATADRTKAQQLAVELSNLEIIDFVGKPDESGKPYGFDAPAYSAEVVFEKDKKDETFKLIVGKQKDDKPEYYAKIEGKSDVFLVGKNIVDVLGNNSLTYRPLEFKKLEAGKIGELRVQKANEKAYTLAPTGRNWEIRQPFQAKALGNLAQPVADTLIALKAERYVAHTASADELEKFGLKEPYLTITMVPAAKGSGSGSGTGSSDGSGSSSGSGSASASGSGSASASGSSSADEPKESVLLIGAVEDNDKGTRYAKFADDGAVFIIAKDPVATLDVKPLALLNPHVLDLPVDAAPVGFQSNPGGKTLKLELKDDKWQVTESAGGAFSADRLVVDELLITLRQLKVKEFKEYGSAIDWEKYGLKSSMLTAVVTAKKEGAKPQQIAFGNAVPDGKGEYYAKINDLPAVVVLDAETSTMLRHDYLSFVNHQVFQDLKPDKVTRIQIQQGERSLVLEKKDTSWQLVASTPAQADESTITHVLQELSGLRAKKVAAFPVKDFKEHNSEPAAAVVKLAGDKEIELQIGKVVDEVTGDRAAMVTGSNTVVVLGGDVARIFLSGPVYFRDHLVARIKDDVNRVVLETGDKKTVFAKVDGTWKRKTEGDDAEADHDELEEFVNSLSKLRADEMAADKPADLKFYGLDAPPIRWRLQAGDKDALVLAIGKGAPDKEGQKQLRHFARVDQGDLIFVLDEKTTIRALGRFRVRRIWPDLIAEQITGLNFQYGKDSFSFTKEGPTWRSSDPTMQVDTKRLEETLKTLANLKAERFVAEKAGDLAPYGLKEPMLILEIQTTKRKLELHVSKTDESFKSHAHVGGATTATEVFLLSFQDSMKIARQLRDFAKVAPPTPPGGDEP